MSARDFALYELDRRALPYWDSALLKPGSVRQPIDPRDIALAEQMTLGVVQNHLHLNWLIESFSGRKLSHVDPLVRKILSVAMYQLRFLDRVPESAAVNEAVSQAKRFGRGPSSGFVNAVLRNVGRKSAPAYPDRVKQPTDYAEKVLSHPRGLFDRLCRLMNPTEALQLCVRNNEPAPAIVRLFPDIDAARLQEPGINLVPHEAPLMYVVDPAKRFTLANWAQKAWAQAQDPTAAGVVEQLRLAPGMVVLDRCAGLGTKTFQIHQRVGERGKVIAMDPAGDRIHALRELATRRGIQNLRAFQAGVMANVPDLANRMFDRALLDVPCSNSGVTVGAPR